MKVVFLSEVEGSGRTGEVKDVADGFARNFLLPRKLAAPASADAVRRAEARAVAEARKQAALDDEARALVAKIGTHAITIQARVGETGRLYGSVTNADIAEEVARVAGAEIDRHTIRLDEPIKQLGSYAVPVRLTRNVEAALQVEVVSTDGKTAADFAALAETEAERETEAEPVEASPDTAAEPVEAEPETEAELVEAEEEDNEEGEDEE